MIAAWSSVREALEVLRESPSRALALFAANLASRVVSACALWLVLASLGVELDLLAVLVVIAASNLLSGLIPVPGNVGVAEAALTAFLVAAGVPAGHRLCCCGGVSHRHRLPAALLGCGGPTLAFAQ